MFGQFYPRLRAVNVDKRLTQRLTGVADTVTQVISIEVAEKVSLLHLAATNCCYWETGKDLKFSQSHNIIGSP